MPKKRANACALADVFAAKCRFLGSRGLAFRTQLIHGQATVNVGTVCNIAQNALPDLIKAVQTLLDELV